MKIIIIFSTTLVLLFSNAISKERCNELLKNNELHNNIMLNTLIKNHCLNEPLEVREQRTKEALKQIWDKHKSKYETNTSIPKLNTNFN